MRYRGIIKENFTVPGSFWNGNEFFTLNPLRNDKNVGSFSINGETGEYYDFATGDSGHIDQLLQGIARRLPDLKAYATETWAQEKWGSYSQHWYYRNKAGRIIGAAVRYNKGGEKNIIPFHLAGNKWKPGHVSKENRPLYNLHKIEKTPRLPILIVEGEKCADTSVDGFILTTWPGGAMALKKADWEPLKNRVVYIWPDNDDAGMKAAHEIEKFLPHAKVLKIPEGKPDGWDIADATPEEIQEVLGSADRPETEEELRQIIERLTEFEFEKAIKDLAKRTGLTEGYLRRVRKEISKDGTGSNGRASMESYFENIEPAEEAQEGGELLDEIKKMIQRFVVMRNTEAVAVTLWVVLTYLTDSVFVLPLLLILSPTKRCGKSTLLEVLARLVYRPVNTAGMSSSALFRGLEKYKPVTLLLDEIDAWIKRDDSIRGLLNAGHTRTSSKIWRTEEVNGQFDVFPFDVWGAKALAGIGRTWGTIEDRGIKITLRRKSNSERIDSLLVMDKEIEKEFKTLRRKLIRWATDIKENVEGNKPVVPDLGNDRARDNWHPLCSIAEQAGARWTREAAEAAISLSAVTEDSEHSLRLLADIKSYFEETGTDKESSEEMCKYLRTIETSPWPEYGKAGAGITPMAMARLLRNFEITPKKIRLGAETKQGYEKEMFFDPWDRYLTRNMEHNNTNSLQHKELECSGECSSSILDPEHYGPEGKCSIFKMEQEHYPEHGNSLQHKELGKNVPAFRIKGGGKKKEKGIVLGKPGARGIFAEGEKEDTLPGVFTADKKAKTGRYVKLSEI